MYTVPKLDDYSPEALDRAVAELFAALDAETAALHSESDWKTFRDRWLARKNGVLTQVNDTWLKAAPGPAKREVGQRVNELKARVEAAIEEAHNKIHASSADAKLAAERLDITLPGIQRPIGVKHPVLRVMDEIVAVFKAMGYSVGEGPEVETDYYNFESLNFPPNHPARDTQDTLFIAGQESKPRARSPAAAHAHFAGADPHHGEAAAAGAHRHPRQGASQRSARRHALAGLPPGRGAGGRHQHHLLRSEGHARSRHEGAVRLVGEDALLSVVLPLHRAQRRHAGELHLLRRQGLPQVQDSAAGSSCWAAAWSIPTSSTS